MSPRSMRLGGVILACALLGAGGTKPTVVLANEAAFAKELAALQADDSTVLVHFWATWCGPCVEEFRTLGPVLSELSTSGVKVMLVSLDETGLATSAVPDFLKKNKASGLSYLLEDADPGAMAAAIDPKWPVGALPATFVFRAGKRLKSFYGPAEAKDVVETIKQARAAK